MVLSTLGLGAKSAKSATSKSASRKVGGVLMLS